MYPLIWYTLCIKCKALAPCLQLSLKKQLDPKNYNLCEEKSVETSYSLTRPIFLDYMYSVSSSVFSTMCFIFIYLYFTLYLYVLINFGSLLILQQKLTEASDIALNHLQ